MRNTSLSRRAMLGAACAMAASAGASRSAGAQEKAGLSVTNENVIRRYYAAWEKKAWPPMDELLADDFTFTSAAGDDHINKAAFRKQCWDSLESALSTNSTISMFLGRAMTRLCCTFALHQERQGTFRNVEYLNLQDGRVAAIECYFGSQSSFPSAVSSAKS